jgi:hypothetical protein
MFTDPPRSDFYLSFETFIYDRRQPCFKRRQNGTPLQLLGRFHFALATAKRAKVFFELKVLSSY